LGEARSLFSLPSLAFHASMPPRLHASMPACFNVFMSPFLHLCILLPIGLLLIHTCSHSLHLSPSFTCPSIELDRFPTDTHHLLTVSARTVQSKTSAERSMGDGRRDTGELHFVADNNLTPRLTTSTPLFLPLYQLFICSRHQLDSCSFRNDDSQLLHWFVRIKERKQLYFIECFCRECVEVCGRECVEEYECFGRERGREWVRGRERRRK